jgi:hypothetical protein
MVKKVTRQQEQVYIEINGSINNMHQAELCQTFIAVITDFIIQVDI